MSASYATVMVQRAYKFALAPTTDQADMFSSHAGGARFAYNWALDQIFTAIDLEREQKAAGQKPTVKVPSHHDLCVQWTAHKDNPANKLGWVGANFVGTYQAALRDADIARTNWRKSLTGQRAGRKMGRPKYKSRHGSTPSFQMHGETLDLVDGSQIKRPKGWKWATSPDGQRIKAPVLLDRIGCAIKLPKIGPVAIPVKIKLPGFEDRNRRVARSLGRALDKPPIPCPPCGATGQIWLPERTLKTTGVTKPAEQITCPTCHGSAEAPVARIVRATLSRGASGLWWVSVTAEVAMRVPGIRCSMCDGSGKEWKGGKANACPECKGLTVVASPSKRQMENGILGLDLGTRSLAVDSDGTVYPNPQHLGQSLDELRVAQQALSRCQPGSKRRERAKRKVGTIHERIGLQRRDSANRLATALTRRFAVVAFEGWDAQRLASKGDATVPKHVQRQRNRRLADAAPGMLRNRCNLKAPWVGSRYFETAKDVKTGSICPVCWTARAKPVPLHEDMFTCDNIACNTKMDRRVATARVVKALAGGAASPAVETPPPTKPRGEGVRPEAVRRGRHPPMKRAARTTTGQRHRPETG